MSDPERPHRKRKIALSAAIYALCYLFLLTIIFVMIIINDPAGWTTYLVEQFSDVLFLVISVFFLVVIVFFYYFFEDRETLVSMNNTLLIFSLFSVSAIICYLFGRYISPYSRPLALFALLSLFLLNRRQTIFLNFIYTFFIFIIDVYTNAYATTELVQEVYSTLMLGFVSGTLAVFFAGSVKTRAGLVFTGVVLALPTSLVVALLNLSSITNDWGLYLANIGYRMLGSVISSVLALALMPVFEALKKYILE